ncbi:MAG: hypothetical protein Q4F41_03450, partial [Eubacteriales bacterium]|nr:hypothetical protein [Eubacteriales bacterium]
MNKKRLLSLLLSLALVLSLFPAPTMAEGESADPEEILCTRSEDCAAAEHEEGCPLLNIVENPTEEAQPEATGLEATESVETESAATEPVETEPVVT